jgi:hypothetical protein
MLTKDPMTWEWLGLGSMVFGVDVLGTLWYGPTMECADSKPRIRLGSCWRSAGMGPGKIPDTRA